MYGRSQTFSIVKWVDFIAKSVRQEADWHVGTIAVTDYWNSVHFSFCSFTVDGVSFFTDGHFNSGVAVNNGNNIVSVFNFSAEGFSENTYRNHGSPSIVDVWSAEFVNGTVEDFVVDQVLFRTDGHNNVTTVSSSFITEGVGEGSGINFAVCSFNSYNNIYSTSSVRFEIETTNAILNCIVCTESNVGFFVALGFDVSGHFAVNLGEVAVFVNNGDFYSVVGVNRTLYRIECESFVQIVLYNGQFFFNEHLVNFVINFYSDDTAKNRLVSWDVWNSGECEWVAFIDRVSSNSRTIYTKAEVGSWSNNLQTLSVNEIYLAGNVLTKSDLIVYSSDGIVVSANSGGRSCGHSDVKAFSALEFSEGEMYSSVLTVVQRNGNGVVTSYEISSWVVTNIFEGVSTAIPSEFNVAVFQSRTFWSVYINEVIVVVPCRMSSSYERQNFCTSSVAIISIGDVELYFAQIVVLVVDVVVISTSEHEAIVLSSFNVYRSHSVLGDVQFANNFIFQFRNSDGVVTSIFEAEGEFKLTFSVGGNFFGAQSEVAVRAGDGELFIFNWLTIVQSSTNNFVILQIVRGDLVVNSVVVGVSSYAIGCFNRSSTSRFIFYSIELNFISYDICSGNINSNAIKNFGIRCNLNLVVSNDGWSSNASWSNDQIYSVTFTSIWEHYVQQIAIVGTSHFIDTVALWGCSDTIDIISSVHDSSEGSIIYNHAILIFNPYIDIAASIQCVIIAIAVCYNEFNWSSFVLSSSTGAFVIDQEIAALNIQIIARSSNLNGINSNVSITINNILQTGPAFTASTVCYI